MSLSKGQKADVTKGRAIVELQVYLGWNSSNAGMEVDGAAFLLSKTGRCERDEDFIFYGQPVSRKNAVVHSSQIGTDKEGFRILLSQLPDDIQKIAFTLTIHEGEKRGLNFSQVSNMYLRMIDATTGDEFLRFDFGKELQQETAIVVGELYIHNGEWKFNAISSGFHGGLAALCNSFGIEVDDEESTKPPVEKVIKPAPQKVIEPVFQKSITPVPQMVMEPVSLKKVELKKKESILIKKTSKVTAVLEWENNKKDLDLYCFYVTKNNQVGKVYYKSLGKASVSPYITLDGDSRRAGSETIVIHRPEELKYVLVAAYSAISNGFGSFKGMKAKAVVDNHAGQTVIAPLLQRNMFSYWVAIAQIDFTIPEGMKISHVESYSKGGSERSPLLYENGEFKIDVGPMEFKR